MFLSDDKQRQEYRLVDIVEALKESNNIEDVWDDQALIQAVRALEFLTDQEQLTVDNIQHMHGILMKNILPREECGRWRRVPVWIANREGKPWSMVPELMAQWILNAQQSKTSEQFVADHVAYEKIHPFIDGNGRTGRIIFIWQHIKHALAIPIIKYKNRLEYYSWFED